jgi:hemoglobin
MKENALQETEIFSAVGEDGFRRLVAAFYRRVPADDILGPMYPPDDMAGAQQRLADFLIYRFGGPATYTEQRGHPRLRMRHNPFSIDTAARDRWMQLMSAALEETELPPGAAQFLAAFFDAMTTFLINRDQQIPMAH